MTQNRWLTLNEVIQALEELDGEADWQDIKNLITRKRGGSYEPYFDRRNYTTSMHQLFQQHCVGYEKYTGRELFRKTREKPLRFQLLKSGQEVLNSSEVTKLSRRGETSEIKQTSTSSSDFVRRRIITDVAEPAAIEGLRTETTKYVWGRSKKLRDLALEESNGICCVCDTDYKNLLDGKGVRVLHVHHRKQIAANDTPVVTRLGDLAVVCANCHMLIHMNPKKALSVEELRKMLGNDPAV